MEIQRLVQVKSGQQIRLNNATTGNCQGSSRVSDSNDAVVIAATVGDGKVLGHFDRNTFFNANGAGTNINRFDNMQLALNMFDWLAEDNIQTFGGRTTSLQLIDADTDIPIQFLGRNTVIDLNEINNPLLDFRAISSPNIVGSFEIALSGPVSFTRTDNTSPYSLFGNDGANFTGRNLSPGNYTITATPYQENNLQGAVGIPLTHTFTIVDNGTSFTGRTTSLQLINADTDLPIQFLGRNTVIDLDEINHPLLDFRAISSPNIVGSFKIELSGPLSFTRTDNTSPYSLF